MHLATMGTYFKDLSLDSVFVLNVGSALRASIGASNVLSHARGLSQP